MSFLDPMLVLELLALGVFTGFLAGLLGIGGGMLMVPFLTFIFNHRGIEQGLAVKMAIATSMATILFPSRSSVRAHPRRGAVRWDLVRQLVPGIVIGGLLSGAGVFSLLKGRALALLFVGFVMSGFFYIWKKGVLDWAVTERDHTPHTVLGEMTRKGFLEEVAKR